MNIAKVSECDEQHTYKYSRFESYQNRKMNKKQYLNSLINI